MCIFQWVCDRGIDTAQVSDCAAVVCSARMLKSCLNMREMAKSNHFHHDVMYGQLSLKNKCMASSRELFRNIYEWLKLVT